MDKQSDTDITKKILEKFSVVCKTCGSTDVYIGFNKEGSQRTIPGKWLLTPVLGWFVIFCNICGERANERESEPEPEEKSE